MVSNKKLGNHFEEEFCELLSEHGFWAHNFAQNKHGQPADIIAAKNDKVYLIDCKVCSNDVFEFSRIEENQRLAMGSWDEKTDFVGWFALKTSEGIYMLPYFWCEHLMSQYSRSNLFDIQKNSIPFEQWVTP